MVVCWWKVKDDWFVILCCWNQQARDEEIDDRADDFIFLFFLCVVADFLAIWNCFRASFSFQSHKPEPYQNLPVRRPTQADVNAKGRELMRHDSEHFAPFQVETSYSEDELDLVLEACENVTSSSCRSCLEWCKLSAIVGPSEHRQWNYIRWNLCTHNWCATKSLVWSCRWSKRCWCWNFLGCHTTLELSS